MSDRRLRELERRAAQSGRDEDALRVLAERCRLGLTSPEPAWQVARVRPGSALAWTFQRAKLWRARASQPGLCRRNVSHGTRGRWMQECRACLEQGWGVERMIRDITRSMRIPDSILFGPAADRTNYAAMRRSIELSCGWLHEATQDPGRFVRLDTAP